MRDPVAPTIHLRDYRPPAYLVDDVDLDFDLRAEYTRVTAVLALRRNPDAGAGAAPLVLDGEDLALESIAIDDRPLAAGDYVLEAGRLTIAQVPAAFTVRTVVRIEPERNTQLMGLYASRDGYFTQCEAEGFRRITWFLDRPDVMARYTTTVHADRDRFPHLLSNGNPVARGEEPGGRHWVRWGDPFRKPCYLFALVAAKLDRLEDSFLTRSGKRARLEIYVEPGRLEEARHAMAALQKSMRWDEEVFGLELDLDHYMIVAVGDFNMGAMENKGLNVFNTKYVLARPEIATDTDYQNIDRVVAHEYFHNWTGNRVTCRDWFQLSLKEGLTVFRDQEFSADMYSRAVARIREVRNLRAAQFPEDAGPMAHPVRPQSYIEISNFYTATVYEKGAEVVRMMHTLLGAEGFRRGMDLYFERHDGQAVTCDDFAQAMQDASGVDLTQFRRWYDQAGTPVLEVEDRYDAAAARYTLTVRQISASGEPAPAPLHVPIAVGLVGADGADLPLRLAGENAPSGTTRVLSLTGAEQCYTFEDVPAPPVPSLLRDFSAPVVLRYPYGEDALTHLMAHDSDAFNRWEAGQRLALNLMLDAIHTHAGRQPLAVPERFVAAFARILADAPADPAFAAEALSLPSELYVAEQLRAIDPDAVHAVRNALARHLGTALRAQWLAAYHAFAVSGPYRPAADDAGRRALRNLCLAYLLENGDASARALAGAQLEGADNMTDAGAALAVLANCDCPEREPALAAFYARWQGEPLVVDKWLRVQATSRVPGTTARVRALTAHPAFEIRNPNKVYSLIGAFAMANQVHFNAADGSGYAFVGEQIDALDRLNPQVAARMARAFDRWRRFDAGRQAHARAALEKLRERDHLSRDTREVVDKALA
ncbi:MAG: aminopeptidase N [Gammaproteobacteria bacterium]|nr:aminopeptidase N [Gammaproteobacteria bacterium]